MMNDQLDLSMLDEQRKKALQALMQRMQANASRSAGLNSLNQAGGGLGRQRIARFRPLTMRNVGILGRFGPRPGRGVSDRFGIVERLPGARDPGAVPGLGGVPADMGSQAAPSAGGAGVPAPIPGGGGGAGGGGGIPYSAGTGPVRGYDPSQPISQDNAPGMDGIGDQTGFTTPDYNWMNSNAGMGPGGYVNVGGVPVPLALFKALNIKDLGA